MKNKKEKLLRIQSLLLSAAIIITMSGCGKKNEPTSDNNPVKDLIYLVPYQDHIYVFTKADIEYEYLIKAFECGENAHEIKFQKFNGTSIRETWRTDEVKIINPQSTYDLTSADEYLESVGQQPLTSYLSNDEKLTLTRTYE